MSRIKKFIKAGRTTLDIESYSMSEMLRILSSPKNKVQEISLNCMEINRSNVGEVAVLILKSPLVSKIDFSECSITDGVMIKLVEALRCIQQPYSLNLSYNEIGPRGAQELASALTRELNLSELILDGNNIGDEGASYLGRSFDSNTSLRSISLIDTCIGDAGGQEIARGLLKNQHIQQLDLSENEIGIDSALEFSIASTNSKSLQKLMISANPIGMIQARVFVRREEAKDPSLLEEKNPIRMHEDSPVRRITRTAKITPRRSQRLMSRTHLNNCMQIALANIYYDYSNYVKSGLSKALPMQSFKELYGYCNRSGIDNLEHSQIDLYVLDFIAKLHGCISNKKICQNSRLFEKIMLVSYAICVPDDIQVNYKKICENRGEQYTKVLLEIAREQVGAYRDIKKSRGEAVSYSNYVVTVGQLHARAAAQEKDSLLANDSLDGKDSNQFRYRAVSPCCRIS